MTAATGTTTLSEMKSTSLTNYDVHIYTKLFTQDGQTGYFDPGLFYNTEEFTMRCDEQHKMLLQGSSFDKADSTVYRAQLVNDELAIDLQHEPGQLCYAITLLTPGVTLTVGPKTSLSLLLRSAQLRVTTYMVTDKLANQLKRSLQERDLVRSQVNTVHQSALDTQQTIWVPYPRDPRKRKAFLDMVDHINQPGPVFRGRSSRGRRVSRGRVFRGRLKTDSYQTTDELEPIFVHGAPP